MTKCMNFLFCFRNAVCSCMSFARSMLLAVPFKRIQWMTNQLFLFMVTNQLPRSSRNLKQMGFRHFCVFKMTARTQGTRGTQGGDEQTIIFQRFLRFSEKVWGAPRPPPPSLCDPCVILVCGSADRRKPLYNVGCNGHAPERDAPYESAHWPASHCPSSLFPNTAPGL